MEFVLGQFFVVLSVPLTEVKPGFWDQEKVSLSLAPE